MKPLVSILICAYNAEKTIAETLESALAQTWPRKEIIVLNDGSKDRTPEIIRQFKDVKLISTENQGFSNAQNNVFGHSQGDYIQYLDADDLLAPDKIERQILALQKVGNPRILASSPWAYFYHRTKGTRFVDNSLCQSLSPVEWLVRKMGENDHMQNATWLVHRELAEKAGPWDASLNYDQDGEFFCRVLLGSDGTCFVPGTGIYYRRTGSSSISFIGNSNQKKESLLVSMKLHIKYLLSLEDSERTRAACVTYLRNWFHHYYLQRTDLAAEIEAIAASLGGRLEPPKLPWKYAWMQKALGWQTATAIQMNYNKLKSKIFRTWDKIAFQYEGGPRHTLGEGYSHKGN
ncbi:MAG TPA: glycosyltransferase family 2 protein [Verrucomicrobiae bacterium]|jgi:glycosyltransferase involved in cell wall biosynthesis